MDETGKHQQHDDKGQSGINRRRFLGALGAAAAPGAILETGGRAHKTHRSTTSKIRSVRSCRYRKRP